jgi:hypothetical protein
MELEVAGVPSLEKLVQFSAAIVCGKVASSLRAFTPSPGHLDTVETDSLVYVDDVLSGAPLGTRTIARPTTDRVL